MGYALRIARSYGDPEPVNTEDLQVGAPLLQVIEGEAGAPSGSEARSFPACIYSRLLKKKMYPSRDPYTGDFLLVTEDGDRWTAADIQALKMIRDAFGIESMEREIRKIPV